MFGPHIGKTLKIDPWASPDEKLLSKVIKAIATIKQSTNIYNAKIEKLLSVQVTHESYQAHTKHHAMDLL